MDEQTKVTLEGFNKGYLLMKHNKTLALKLLDGLPEKENDFMTGMKAGIKEASLEKQLIKNKPKHFDLKYIQTNVKSKDKERDKDL